MRSNLTHAIEDYLKAIYDLTTNGERAGTNEIAEKMGVAPASATGMIQRLAQNDPALVEYQKHRGVALTPAGERAALEVIRLHRLLETFLQRALGYTWDEVHAEADRLEHVVSPEFVERIVQAMGDPTIDPHGEPIPSRDLDIPPESGKRLNEILAGRSVTVQRVAHPDPDLLRYLSKIGLIPGATLTVLDVSSFDDNLRLQVDGQPISVVLGPRVTRVIVVNEDGL